MKSAGPQAGAFGSAVLTTSASSGFRERRRRLVWPAASSVSPYGAPRASWRQCVSRPGARPFSLCGARPACGHQPASLCVWHALRRVWHGAERHDARLRRPVCACGHRVSGGARRQRPRQRGVSAACARQRQPPQLVSPAYVQFALPW